MRYAIVLSPDPYCQKQYAFMTAIAPVLAANGMVPAAPAEADLLLLQTNAPGWAAHFAAARKVILLLHHDMSFVPEPEIRAAIADPKCVAAWNWAAPTPREILNGDVIELGSQPHAAFYHMTLLMHQLHQSVLKTSRCQPRLGPEALAKVRPLQSPIVSAEYADWGDSPVPPLAARRHDVAVFCTVDNGGQWPLIAHHRAKAIEATLRLQGQAAIRAGASNLPPAEWRALCHDTRIVISPWGWGEFCYRDTDALLAGAILMKPYSDHCETLPNIYQAGITYVPVRPDFSDVGDKVRHVLAHLAFYQGQADAVREELRRFRTLERMAALVLDEFRRAA